MPNILIHFVGVAVILPKSSFAQLEMAPGKEEKKDDMGKDKTEGKEEKKKDGNEMITAIYRVNLHCQECGSKIKKHLMTTQGIYELILIHLFLMLL